MTPTQDRGMTLATWAPPRFDRTMDPHTRTLRCACGGSVRADRWEPAAGIRSHQRTTLHQAWRERMGL